MNVLRRVVIAAVLVIGTSLSTTASAQTIVDEWADVKTPPAPACCDSPVAQPNNADKPVITNIVRCIALYMKTSSRIN